MKIAYEFERKEFKDLLNWSCGIYYHREKIKKKNTKRVMQWSKIVEKEIIISILYFLCIFFFFPVFPKKWFLKLLIIIWIINLYIPFCLTIIILLFYRKKFQNMKKGVIKIGSWGIENIDNKGNVNFASWNEIDYGIEIKNYLYLYQGAKMPFVIPLHINRKKIFEMMKEKQPALILLKKKEEKTSKIIPFWKNYYPYILLVCLVFTSTTYFRIQNNKLLNFEFEKIKEERLDEEIYTKGYYAKIEKQMKEFYMEIEKNSKIYKENSAESMFQKMTVTYLKNEKSNLPPFQKNLIQTRNTSEQAIDTIINWLEQDHINTVLAQCDLDDWNKEKLEKYLQNKDTEEMIQKWKTKKEQNQKKYNALNRILSILTDKSTIWYIESEKLYIKDNQKREEYNRLYHLILDEEK